MARQFWTPLLLVVALLPATVLVAAAQEEGEGAVIKVAASDPNEDGEARIDVNIEEASNVGAFEFVLVFDDQVLEVARVERGGFIAQSGREVLCLDPVVEPGAMRYECLTLGDTPATGSEGSGTLASVFLTSKGDGESPVQLTRAKIADPMGGEMPLTVVGDTLEVFGDDGGGVSWWIIAVAAGVGVLIVAVVGGILVRRRGGSIAPRSGAGLDQPGNS